MHSPARSMKGLGFRVLGFRALGFRVYGADCELLKESRLVWKLKLISLLLLFYC